MRVTNRRGIKRGICASSAFDRPSITTLRPRSRARNAVATTCSGVRLRPTDAASPAMSKKGVSAFLCQLDHFDGVPGHEGDGIFLRFEQDP